MRGAFSILDYVVFLGTLAISMLIGVYYAFVKKQTTNADLLVGGRSMPIIPTSLSLLATYMSAILILGFCGEIYSHGTLITELIVGTFLWIPLGGVLFLPTLYRLRLTSAYEYLGMRFESDAVRLIATITFVVQIILYMGVVLYAPSVALNAVTDVPIWASIVAVGGCAAIYTSIGGLKAVVWTDCFQICMMFAGMLSIIIQGTINVGGFGNVFKIANDHGRIEYLKLDMDPFIRQTSLGLFFGQGVFWMSSYGTHQTTVQRYCSMDSLSKAFWALIWTAPLVAITMSLAALCGVVIFSNFAECDPITLGLITKNDQIAPFFVLEYLSPTSGLVGLFIACLYSGALSTVSSGLNSLAAVSWQDFCSRINYFKKMNDGQQGTVTKVIGMLYGMLSIGMGFIAGNLGGILNAAIVVNGSVSGPLLGVFILGVLLPFTNKYGAITGMLIAHFITLGIGIGGLIVNVKHPTLPYSIDGCGDEIISRVSNFTEILLKHQNQSQSNFTMAAPPEIEWPRKIFTLSYLLYPLLGSVITVVVGSVVSIFTGPTKLTKGQEKYTHPAIVYVANWLRGSDKVTSNGANGHNEPQQLSRELHLHQYPGYRPNQFNPQQYRQNGHQNGHGGHQNGYGGHQGSSCEAYFGQGGVGPPPGRRGHHQQYQGYDNRAFKQ